MSLRRLAVIVLSAAAALLAGVVLYLAFGDLGRHKGRIETLATELLGRPFAIDGAFELEVLPSISLVAERVRLGNAQWGSQLQMVEIVAGQHRDGHRVSTDVGVSIVDTPQGRVLVSPSKAFDGEWVSSFTPATPLAIAAAVERLTAALPDGPWFPQLSLTRDFDRQTEPQKEEQCPTTL